MRENQTQRAEQTLSPDETTPLATALEKTRTSRRKFFALSALVAKITHGLASGAVTIEPKAMSVDFPGTPDEEFRYDQELVDRFQERFGQYFQLITTSEEIEANPALTEAFNAGGFVLERPSRAQVMYLYSFFHLLEERSEYLTFSSQLNSQPVPLIFVSDTSLEYTNRQGSQQEIFGMYHNQAAEVSANNTPFVILDAFRSSIKTLDRYLPHELAHHSHLEVESQSDETAAAAQHLLETNAQLLPNLDTTNTQDIVYDTTSAADLIGYYLMIYPRRWNTPEFEDDPTLSPWPGKSFRTDDYDRYFMEVRPETNQDRVVTMGSDITPPRWEQYQEPEYATGSIGYAGTNFRELVAEMSQIVALQGVEGVKVNFGPGIKNYLQKWGPGLVAYYEEMASHDVLEQLAALDPLGILIWDRLKTNPDSLDDTIDEIVDTFCLEITRLILQHIWRVPAAQLEELRTQGFSLLPELHLTAYQPNDSDENPGAELSRTDLENMSKLRKLYQELST